MPSEPQPHTTRREELQPQAPARARLEELLGADFASFLLDALSGTPQVKRATATP